MFSHEFTRSIYMCHSDLVAAPLLMASISPSSTDDIRRKFSQDAVLFIEDSVVGERVKEMQQRGFPIESADGLDFCKLNALDDTVCRKHYRPGFSLIFFQRIRHVLEAMLTSLGLGIYEVYRFDPNYIYAFMTGLNSELKAIVVQLWSPQSSVVFYGGSHLLPIRGFPASNGLLDIPYAPLKEGGCKSIEVEMERGGL
jgi:hypothetical protein